MQRRATTAVALALGLFSAPAGLNAQTRTGPAPDTPKLLVAVFASNDRTSGVQAADAIRNRITSAVSVRTLYVIPKEQIDNYLTSSGYKPDSALGPSDLKELAKLLRADEVLLGTVTKTPSGVKIEARLALARDPAQAQALPAIEAANANEAARQIERALSETRKQLPDNRLCENSARDALYPKAIAAANAGILKYPNATLARLCLARTFVAMKAPPDSVLRVVSEIRKIDPKNTGVFPLAFQAYTDKGDQESAVNSLVQWLKLEPGNQTLSSQIITELAKLGKPSVAIPIMDDLLAQNPGDPQLLRTKWQLTLAAAQADTGSTSRPTLLGAAVAAGEAMVNSDSTLADSAYFARQIAAASGMTGNPQKFVEFASKATQRFPNNPEFWYLRANAERRAGQLQMAQQSMSRVLQINPKYPNANVFVAQVFIETNQQDSAVAAARRAVAAGEDPKIWGSFLLTPTNALFKKAQESKSVPEFRRVLTLAQESDRLSPSATSKFFIGVASYFIAVDLLQQAQGPIQQAQRTENKRTKASLNAKGCPFAKEGQDMILLIQTNMPQGGSVEPSTAQAILSWVGQAAPAADQMAKNACK